MTTTLASVSVLTQLENHGLSVRNRSGLDWDPSLNQRDQQLTDPSTFRCATASRSTSSAACSRTASCSPSTPRPDRSPRPAPTLPAAGIRGHRAWKATFPSSPRSSRRYLDKAADHDGAVPPHRDARLRRDAPGLRGRRPPGRRPRRAGAGGGGGRVRRRRSRRPHAAAARLRARTAGRARSCRGALPICVAAGRSATSPASTACWSTGFDETGTAR